jgi:hypothetical protein
MAIIINQFQLIVIWKIKIIEKIIIKIQAMIHKIVEELMHKFMKNMAIRINLLYRARKNLIVKKI